MAVAKEVKSSLEMAISPSVQQRCTILDFRPALYQVLSFAKIKSLPLTPQNRPPLSRKGNSAEVLGPRLSEHLYSKKVAEKDELKMRVLAARDSLQAFYNSMDNLTLLLEAKVMDLCL